MHLPTRTRPVAWVLTLLILGFAPSGCGSSAEVALSPSVTMDPAFGVGSTISVTSAPPGAEVWVGPGCGSGATSGAGVTASAAGGGGAPVRYLGRAPLKAAITAGDVSPDGALDYSIRYETLRRNGRIEHADRLIRRGGSVRIEVDLRRASSERSSAAD